MVNHRGFKKKLWPIAIIKRSAPSPLVTLHYSVVPLSLIVDIHRWVCVCVARDCHIHYVSKDRMVEANMFTFDTLLFFYTPLGIKYTKTRQAYADSPLITVFHYLFKITNYIHTHKQMWMRHGVFTFCLYYIISSQPECYLKIDGDKLGWHSFMLR